MARNSDRFRTRSRAENRPVGRASDTELSDTELLLVVGGHSEPPAAATTTVREHGATARRLQPPAKPVGTAAANIVRLVGAFHESTRSTEPQPAAVKKCVVRAQAGERKQKGDDPKVARQGPGASAGAPLANVAEDSP